MIYIKKNPLRVLRNFGNMIKNFRMNSYGISKKLFAKIGNYLAIYCADSLERIIMVDTQMKIPFKNLRKPLKKVIFLRIIIEYPGPIMGHVHIRHINERIFPNVNEIVISSGGYDFSGEKKPKNPLCEYRIFLDSYAG